MDQAPDLALVERFRADLARLWSAGGRVGLAVSGGPDSLALLLLANAALPGQVEAATVDHGLRADSSAEAAMVARICTGLGVPHATLVVTVGKGNVQDRARTARYAALGDWMEERGLGALLTAHQMDDQAETLVMRLNRGSGLSGLAGIRARTSVPGHSLALLRPLLGWRREELAGILGKAGLTAASDPGNADPRFDRARIRQALARASWIAVPGLARSAALLAEAEEAIAFAITREFDECVAARGDGFAYAALRTGMAGPNLIRIGVIEAIGRALGGSLGAGGSARMAGSLVEARPCNIGGIAARTTQENGEQVWLFARENPRKAG